MRGVAARAAAAPETSPARRAGLFFAKIAKNCQVLRRDGRIGRFFL